MSFKKLKGLFVNTDQANCSIYESGRMIYDCLKISANYQLNYAEVNDRRRQISTGYDFYAFNYHHLTMGWLDVQSVRRLPGLKLTFVLETLRNDPFALCPSTGFDIYCALDPTMKSSDERVYAFPRPLEIAPPLVSFQEPEIPVIGSFGFATEGKGFELVVAAVGREFGRAQVRINIPPGTYTSEAYAAQLIERCYQSAKPGIDVQISRNYLSKNELIEWCSQNTLNCFLYNRDMPGLSATTDQAIASGRPLSISTNETFRHIHSRIQPYPLRSLRDSIGSSQSEVIQLQKDWQPENFVSQFERVLADSRISADSLTASSLPATQKLAKANAISARVKRASLRIVKEVTPPILLKAVKRVRSGKKHTALPPQMQPFLHPLLQSHSQFNEDLLIDLLLGAKNHGFYADVGANDPVFNNNTQRFYRRGWSGINMEPGIKPYQKLCQSRTRDVNLNIGVGSKRGSLTFYDIEADPSLSSFDEQAARDMATHFGLAVTPKPIEVRPLSDIFAKYAADRNIDFLSVDAEGMDLDVLKSNDWQKYRPLLILVEMNNEHTHILRYMSGQDYILAFNNHYNGLFVDLRTSYQPLKQLLIDYY